MPPECGDATAKRLVQFVKFVIHVSARVTSPELVGHSGCDGKDANKSSSAFAMMARSVASMWSCPNRCINPCTNKIRTSAANG